MDSNEKSFFQTVIRNCTHSHTLGLQPIRIIDVDAIRTGNSHQRTNKSKSKTENICLRNRYVVLIYFLVAFICFFFAVIGKLNDFFFASCLLYFTTIQNGSGTVHCVDTVEAQIKIFSFWFLFISIVATICCAWYFELFVFLHRAFHFSLKITPDSMSVKRQQHHSQQH